MAERDEVRDELLEHAKHFAALTSIGVARGIFERGGAAPHAPEPPPLLRRNESGSAASLSLPGDAEPPSGNREAPSGGNESGSAASLEPAVVSVASISNAAAPAAESLEDIREFIGDCRRCKLAGGRKTIVFGQGSPHARLMFVGEAPGADEDEQGLAFVGKAGQLLTKIIEAIGLTRDEVFIANVIKCRPPQNRNPEPDEIVSCQPFLERQIDAIHPRVLVGLGKFAGQWLLKTMEPISRIRGRIGSYRGIDVMPTWHPAYLLRNPAAKKDVWEDMKAVRRILDS